MNIIIYEMNIIIYEMNIIMGGDMGAEGSGHGGRPSGHGGHGTWRPRDMEADIPGWGVIHLKSTFKYLTKDIVSVLDLNASHSLVHLLVYV
jgi:hypothetical protein